LEKFYDKNEKGPARTGPSGRRNRLFGYSAIQYGGVPLRPPEPPPPPLDPLVPAVPPLLPFAAPLPAVPLPAAAPLPVLPLLPDEPDAVPLPVEPDEPDEPDEPEEPEEPDDMLPPAEESVAVLPPLPASPLCRLQAARLMAIRPAMIAH
jgi:hypothetical protein